MTRLLHEYKDTLLSSVVLRSQVEVSLSESAAIPFIQFLLFVPNISEFDVSTRGPQK